MDLDILFYVAIAVFYLIAQLLSGRKRKPQPGPTSPPSPRRQPAGADRTGRAAEGSPTSSRRQVPQPAASTELDDALREIRAALGWETPEPEPVAPPPTRPEPIEASPPPQTEPIPRAKIETAVEKKIPPSRIESVRPAGVPRPRRPKPTPVPSKPFEWREQKTAWDALLPDKKVDRPRSVAAESSWRKQERDQHKRINDLRRRLHSPETAWDAFVMAEIFARRRHRL